MHDNGYATLALECAELPEVGDPVEIETPAGAIRATWLGVVSNGRELGAALRLMNEIAAEREAQRGGD